MKKLIKKYLRKNKTKYSLTDEQMKAFIRPIIRPMFHPVSEEDIEKSLDNIVKNRHWHTI